MKGQEEEFSHIGYGMMAYCIALGTFWTTLPPRGPGGSRAWATEPDLRGFEIKRRW